MLIQKRPDDGEEFGAGISGALAGTGALVETKDGPRTRVRVGPFSDKAQAESSASKIKTLDLPASILVL